jgi:hypothetical protein
VIWQGLILTLALLGKLAVGFMVPNFTQDTRFTGVHFRDCLMTGFSMAAEGEFAFGAFLPLCLSLVFFND